MKKLQSLFILLFTLGVTLNVPAQVVKSFYVYPNPVQNDLNVGIEINTFGRLNLDFYDIIGQKVMSPFSDSVFWPGNYLETYDVSHLQNGVYIVTLSTSTGEVQNIKVVKNSPLSVGDLNRTSFNVYPNPAQNQIHLPENLAELKIYDLTGKLVLSQMKPSNTMDISLLNNGLYLIVLMGESSTRFVLEIQK